MAESDPGTGAGRIVVINPNSTEAVTAGIERAVAPLRLEGGPRIDCLTLAEGPPGIETQAHVDLVVGPLLARLEHEPADAVVIACYSDPGLHSARERFDGPVLGIAESAIATALTLGQRFGVVAILPGSIPRHLRLIGAMGVSDRLAAERALGLGVTELANPSRTFERMRETGRSLIEQDGADVIILGCAGMADYREALEQTLGVPVVDPCQAAVTMALGRVLLAR